MDDFAAGTTPIKGVGWVRYQPLDGFGPLQGDEEAAVVVIGAGLAGSTIALRLAEHGVDVAMVEAKQPGDGASGRNAGHVQPFLHTLKPAKEWPDQGKRLLDMVIEQKHIVYDLCRENGIEADAVEGGMIEAGVRPYGELRHIARRWAGNGYDVGETGGRELADLLGTDRYKFGIRWAEGGRVNPYLFTHGLARAAQKKGARVYGDSRVIGCDRQGERWRVRTSGGSILADRVIVCTNGHMGESFFPELEETQFPLVACGVATTPLPDDLRAVVNPSGAAFVQFPAGLFPMIVDEHGRVISATIPRPGRVGDAGRHFRDLLRYLNETWPATRSANIQMDAYWTGMTANSSHVYHADYPQMIQVAPGVLAFMNLGTWGVFLGPMLGRNLADAIAADRLEDVVLPIRPPRRQKVRGRFAYKIRYALLPAARIADRTGKL